MKILITGGSGTLGSALTQKLLKNNIEVVHLTREKNSKNDVKNYLSPFPTHCFYYKLQKLVASETCKKQKDGTACYRNWELGSESVES